MFSTNYKVVDVKDELPEVEDTVVVVASKFGKLQAEGTSFIGRLENNNTWTVLGDFGEIKDYDNNPDYWKITHWLKPIPNSIILTQSELLERDKRVAAEAWEAAAIHEFVDIEYGQPNPHPNKEQYLNSLNKQ